jgi:hypothetical protein
MSKVRTSKVLASYGVWAVTTYGLECTVRPYPIARNRLWESDWTSHIKMKTWPPPHTWSDFVRALAEAKKIHQASRRSKP